MISNIGGEILGNNMFAYCMNNPVNMLDCTGNWPRWITAAVAAVATVVAVVAAVVAAPAVATVATAAAVISTTTYVAQSRHYDERKANNGNVPKTRQEAKALGWHGPDTTPKGPAASCHQFTSPDKSNVKYVSPDGYREAIYDSTGTLVLDARDIGTYNFSPSNELWYSKESLGHLVVDIIPWVLFGNDDDDPGPMVNCIVSWFE